MPDAAGHDKDLAEELLAMAQQLVDMAAAHLAKDAPPPVSALPASTETRYWIVTSDSNAITRYREKFGWSRGELARRAGVSVTTIIRIEQGNPTCHIRTIGLVAAALGQPSTAIELAQ